MQSRPPVLHNLNRDYDTLPPPLPPMPSRKQKRRHSSGKNNHTSRPWEDEESEIPWEQREIERHPIEEVEQLEQVAKRLVAKAKEMIEPPEETKRKGFAVRPENVTDEEMRDLEWIIDLMIDALSVIQNKGEKKRILRKWVAEKAKWAE